MEIGTETIILENYEKPNNGEWNLGFTSHLQKLQSSYKLSFTWKHR